MVNHAGLEPIRVLEQVYRPFEQPGDLVSAFVGALVDSASVQGAEVRLGANGHSMSVSRGWDAGVARHADRLPLTYGTRRLGELLLETDSSRASREERFGEAARALSCLLQRYHARHAAAGPQPVPAGHRDRARGRLR